MRVYLDWNATAPLRPEARAAFAEGLDLVGNPSSVHAEGRAAKMALERAREAVAAALGVGSAERVVFLSGATEAASLVLEGRGLAAAGVEHDAVLAWAAPGLAADADGRVAVPDPARTTLQLANGETGVVQDLPEGLAASDLTQGFGKLPFAFDWSGVRAGFVSAHKIGGPKGIGAVALAPGEELPARIRGGGQERGRRAGTENLPAAMAFAAAATAAQADLSAGMPEKLSEMRDRLLARLEAAAEGLMFPGRGAVRLPNTLSVLTPGWPGETQVMQMDLAGFAVSAGSACSSGKLRPSGVLRAMGVAEADASCAIRVSFGPTTPAADLDRFADAWATAHARWRARRAGA